MVGVGPGWIPFHTLVNTSIIVNTALLVPITQSSASGLPTNLCPFALSILCLLLSNFNYTQAFPYFDQEATSFNISLFTPFSLQSGIPLTVGPVTDSSVGLSVESVVSAQVVQTASFLLIAKAWHTWSFMKSLRFLCSPVDVACAVTRISSLRSFPLTAVNHAANIFLYKALLIYRHNDFVASVWDRHEQINYQMTVLKLYILLLLFLSLLLFFERRVQCGNLRFYRKLSQFEWQMLWSHSTRSI